MLNQGGAGDRAQAELGRGDVLPGKEGENPGGCSKGLVQSSLLIGVTREKTWTDLDRQVVPGPPCPKELPGHLDKKTNANAMEQKRNAESSGDVPKAACRGSGRAESRSPRSRPSV